MVMKYLLLSDCSEEEKYQPVLPVYLLLNAKVKD